MLWTAAERARLAAGASCWMALWWLSSLNGIVMRGERSVVMPSVGNAHTILMRTAKWRARAKERVQAKKRQREKKSKKEAEAGDDMRCAPPLLSDVLPGACAAAVHVRG